MNAPNRSMRILIADASNLFFSDDFRDGWQQGFRDIGCEVATLDLSILGKHARNNPYSTGGAGRISKHLAANAAAHKPDLVFCHHGRYQATGEFLEELRRRGIPTAVYLCDEPYETGETVSYSTKYDFVFSIDPCTLSVHRGARGETGATKVFYLPAAANPQRFKSIPYKERVGPPALFLGNATLVPRPDWLSAIAKVIPGAEVRYFDSVRRGDPRWIALAQYPKLYANCLVGLNVHRAPEITEKAWRERAKVRRVGVRPITGKPERWGTGFWNYGDYPAAHVNPRFFEMAACGTLVVSDDARHEMWRMFPFAPRAQDPEHFMELVCHYVERRNESEELGALCRREVMSKHTYEHRAVEILIRCGLWDERRAGRSSSLGDPASFITPQDFSSDGMLRAPEYGERTGRFERYEPTTGSLLMHRSGSQNSRALLIQDQPQLASSVATSLEVEPIPQPDSAPSDSLVTRPRRASKRSRSEEGAD